MQYLCRGTSILIVSSLLVWAPGHAMAQAAKDTPEALIIAAYELEKKLQVHSEEDLTRFDPLNGPQAPKFFTKRALQAYKGSSSKAKSDEAPDFEGDVFVDAQDVVFGPIDIQRLSGDTCSAKVEVKFDNQGKATKIDFDLIRTKAGWRISEVHGSDYALTGIGRKKPLPSEKAECKG